MKHVIITRVKDDGIQTLGELATLGFYCKTLERPWLNNKQGMSCIPKGDYICKWTYSPRFLKYTYQVMDVPKRTGIRLHSGNYWWNINGCILLGNKYGDINNDKTVDILNTKLTIKKFEEFMKKEDFKLTIK